MTRSTEDLIAELARRARPVRRLPPPLLRAALWLGLIAVIAGAGVWRFSDMATFLSRAAHPRFALELAGTLLTGIAGVIAAFHLSLPDRPRAWALLPLPPLALWLGSSGYECWRHWLERRGDSWAMGDSAMCFMFIVAVSLPIAALLFWRLRKANPLDPGLVTLMGALGVAALSAFVLQFFHPFEVSFMDLGLHLAAVGVVLAAGWGPGRWLMRTA